MNNVAEEEEEMKKKKKSVRFDIDKNEIFHVICVCDYCKELRSTTWLIDLHRFKNRCKNMENIINYVFEKK